MAQGVLLVYLANQVLMVCLEKKVMLVSLVLDDQVKEETKVTLVCQASLDYQESKEVRVISDLSVYPVKKEVQE